ncbi:hypothetical protein HETIRDRAFT_119914 [Heterobasidion irregulare TC 32-1]|uniref:Uncharacterized protein n=1 Tax=Heterobasidion irregulare (strain TC 32-1) TaxID=747525 RepID=W4JWF7_HETIT|nr:uncharacterized protein HETIRDRAFT_119914 [Heterobasidion irregulare TC 32-1]ETW77898.1 hypothetical protein HETIRDRAFT_119914 [Heterobasidion irregulare TC 32-1]
MPCAVAICCAVAAAGDGTGRSLRSRVDGLGAAGFWCRDEFCVGLAREPELAGWRPLALVRGVPESSSGRSQGEKPTGKGNVVMDCSAWQMGVDVIQHDALTSTLSVQAVVAENHEGRQKEVYRGTLPEPIKGVAPYDAWKVTCGQSAMRKLRHEAELYQEALQDAWVLDIVPGTRFEKYTRPVSPTITFPRGMSSIATAFQRLFEDANERESGRKTDITVSSLEQHPYEFRCEELFEICTDFKLWKPSQWR